LTVQNGLQAVSLDPARGGALSKLSFFESSDSISAACKDGLHNPREAVVMRIGVGYKASFCSQ